MTKLLVLFVASFGSLAASALPAAALRRRLPESRVASTGFPPA